MLTGKEITSAFPSCASIRTLTGRDPIVELSDVGDSMSTLTGNEEVVAVLSVGDST